MRGSGHYPVSLPLAPSSGHVSTHVLPPQAANLASCAICSRICSNLFIKDNSATNAWCWDDQCKAFQCHTLGALTDTVPFGAGNGKVNLAYSVL